MIATFSEPLMQGAGKVKVPVPSSQIIVFRKILQSLSGAFPGERCELVFIPSRSSREWVNDVCIPEPEPPRDENDDLAIEQYENALNRIARAADSIRKKRLQKMRGMVQIKIWQVDTFRYFISLPLNYAGFCKLNETLRSVPKDWEESERDFWNIITVDGREIQRHRVPFQMKAYVPAFPDKFELVPIKTVSI